MRVKRKTEIYFSLKLNKMWRAEPILLSVLPNQKWQMRIESLARRRPTRSSWGRRSKNKMFWQLSRGRGRALSFQLRISNGDPSSILISGTFMALIVTESRSYKPWGISSNYWLIFSQGYILHYVRVFTWICSIDFETKLKIDTLKILNGFVPYYIAIHLRPKTFFGGQ